MRQIMMLVIALTTALSTSGQGLRYDFTAAKKGADGYVHITAGDTYSEEKGYGYDLLPAPTAGSDSPFFFSVAVPDGNYRVTAVVGSKHDEGETTLRAESRRLFYENVATRKGQFVTCSFIVNKRDTVIAEGEVVHIKGNERQKLNWDNKLTIEVNGRHPRLAALVIERVDSIPTLFLCGNSTVVDQDDEPWASWGQMLPRFLTDSIAVANYAESGESANTFIAVGRLAKALTQMHAGDYIIMEFGHNDQKQKGPGKGAYYSFMTSLKVFIDEARARGAYPILVTPTCRRFFDSEGHVMDTHDDYPDAMRWLAEKENVPLIELNGATKVLYEALGVEGSKKAFVHYPAGTYPNQEKALADNTHFNAYGAYEIAKCVIEGMKALGLPLVNYLRNDYTPFDAAAPDDAATFLWCDSPFTTAVKPDGN